MSILAHKSVSELQSLLFLGSFPRNIITKLSVTWGSGITDKWHTHTFFFKMGISNL